MKRLFYMLLFVASSFLGSGCKFDNYDPPKSLLKGRIVYGGEPINVGYNDVKYQLWEPGWQLSTPIEGFLDQDGSYSMLLFNANYKMVFQRGQGPFIPRKNDDTNSDTLLITVKGNQELDIEVTPYYMIRNAQFSQGSNAVTATCRLEQIVTGADAKDVERVSLYLSKTTFVDGRTQVAFKDLPAADITDMNNISMSVNVPAMIPSQNYIFARIGVKIRDVEDMLFSPIEKIQF